MCSLWPQLHMCTNMQYIIQCLRNTFQSTLFGTGERTIEKQANRVIELSHCHTHFCFTQPSSSHSGYYLKFQTQASMCLTTQLPLLQIHYLLQNKLPFLMAPLLTTNRVTYQDDIYKESQKVVSFGISFFLQNSHWDCASLPDYPSFRFSWITLLEHLPTYFFPSGYFLQNQAMIFSTPKTLVLLENIHLCILGETQCPGVSCSSNRIPSKKTWYIPVGTHGTGVDPGKVHFSLPITNLL